MLPSCAPSLPPLRPQPSNSTTASTAQASASSLARSTNTTRSSTNCKWEGSASTQVPSSGTTCPSKAGSAVAKVNYCPNYATNNIQFPRATTSKSCDHLHCDSISIYGTLTLSARSPSSLFETTTTRSILRTYAFHAGNGPL
jgi:hypothetical protein